VKINKPKPIVEIYWY